MLYLFSSKQTQDRIKQGSNVPKITQKSKQYNYWIKPEQSEKGNSET